MRLVLPTLVSNDDSDGDDNNDDRKATNKSKHQDYCAIHACFVLFFPWYIIACFSAHTVVHLDEEIFRSETCWLLLPPLESFVKISGSTVEHIVQILLQKPV